MQKNERFCILSSSEICQWHGGVKKMMTTKVNENAKNMPHSNADRPSLKQVKDIECLQKYFWQRHFRSFIVISTP